jgi:hypothetical protein
VAERKDAPFAGSNRQIRGRIIDALRASPQSVDQLQTHLTSLGLTLDTPKLTSIIAGLGRDGLVVITDDLIKLPD